MEPKLQELIEGLSGSASGDAADALAALGLEAMVAALNTPEMLTRLQGRRRLSAHLAGQDPAAVTPPLLAALAYVHWAPNQVAIDALCAMGEPAIPALIANLTNEPDGHGRRQTITALRRMDAIAAVAPLARLGREDPVTEVRARAIQALGMLGAEDSGPTIIAALGDKSHVVRLEATKAAGWLRLSAAVDTLLELLRSKSSQDRAAAVYALDRIGDTRATAAVTELLADPSPYVRWAAAVALRRLWKDDCQAALQKALKDGEGTVATAALETLFIMAPSVPPHLLAEVSADRRRAFRPTVAYYSQTPAELNGGG